MKDLLDVFKALCEQTRLRIIKLLEQGELCVCDIVAALDMIQPKVSFHLAVLKEAGLSPKGVHPLTKKVMEEIGIDISQQTSKAIDDELLKTIDFVITLCDDAAESCPWTPPQIKRIHWPMKDPVTSYWYARGNCGRSCSISARAHSCRIGPYALPGMLSWTPRRTHGTQVIKR